MHLVMYHGLTFIRISKMWLSEPKIWLNPKLKMWLNGTTAHLLFLPPPSLLHLHHAIHYHRRRSCLTKMTPHQLLSQTRHLGARETMGGGRWWRKGKGDRWGMSECRRGICWGRRGGGRAWQRQSCRGHRPAGWGAPCEVLRSKRKGEAMKRS